MDVKWISYWLLCVILGLWLMVLDGDNFLWSLTTVLTFAPWAFIAWLLADWWE